MMADPKPDLEILARDPAFSKTIRTQPVRRSPFKIRDEEDYAEEKNDHRGKGENANVASVGQDQRNATPETQHTTIRSPRDVTKDSVTTKQASRKKPAKGQGPKAAMIVCRISFRVGEDLMDRAEKLAKVAKCPRQRVLTVAFNELRPKLVASASGIQEGDVPDDRNVDTTGRLDTTLKLPENTAKELEHRLDPAGFNGLNRLLSRWARNEFASFFDQYLSKKGY